MFLQQGNKHISHHTSTQINDYTLPFQHLFSQERSLEDRMQESSNKREIIEIILNFYSSQLSREFNASFYYGFVYFVVDISNNV